jgi:hypothetical protein
LTCDILLLYAFKKECLWQIAAFFNGTQNLYKTETNVMLDMNAIIGIKDATQTQTDAERFVCDILQAEGTQTVLQLVRRLSDYMYREELRNWGWVVGIGILGPSGFQRDALDILDNMNGRCLAVVGDNNK